MCGANVATTLPWRPAASYQLAGALESHTAPEMHSESDLLVAAWREAADDLGIRVLAPFLAADPLGAPIRFDALVCDFGWPKGTLVTPLDESSRQRRAAYDSGYNLCSLNTDLFGKYLRTEWIALLRDWIWVGDGAVPSWHRGRGWITEPATIEIVKAELARIFGRDIQVEGSIPHLMLPFVAGKEVIAFLRSVPTGYTSAAVTRWATDVRARLEPGGGWP